VDEGELGEGIFNTEVFSGIIIVRWKVENFLRVEGDSYGYTECF